MVRHPSAFLQHVLALFLSLGNHESLSHRVNAAIQERLPDFAFTSPSGDASM